MNKPKLDPRNARTHSEKNKKAIRDSLEKLGTGRSVVVDADDVLIAGNGVFEQAEALGIPYRVIETDGSELVVIKRTDLAPDDDRRVALALADNRTTDLSVFDWKELPDLFKGMEDEMVLAAGFSPSFVRKLDADWSLPSEVEDINEDKLGETSSECPKCGHKW